jgi:Transposase IS116/IS110/IS902 family
MVCIVEDLAGDWRRLDERVEGLSNEIEAIARQDAGCGRLMSVPGIGPIISGAMVAAIGAGDVFTRGRDFAAWRRRFCYQLRHQPSRYAAERDHQRHSPFCRRNRAPGRALALRL